MAEVTRECDGVDQRLAYLVRSAACPECMPESPERPSGSPGRQRRGASGRAPPGARRDLSLRKDRQHPALFEGPHAARVAWMSRPSRLTGMQPTRLQNQRDLRPVVVFPSDHEAQDPAAASLQHQVVDPAGMVGDQDRRAGPATGPSRWSSNGARARSRRRPAVQEEPASRGSRAGYAARQTGAGQQRNWAGREASWQGGTTGRRSHGGSSAGMRSRGRISRPPRSPPIRSRLRRGQGEGSLRGDRPRLRRTQRPVRRPALRAATQTSLPRSVHRPDADRRRLGNGSLQNWSPSMPIALRMSRGSRSALQRNRKPMTEVRPEPTLDATSVEPPRGLNLALGSVSIARRRGGVQELPVWSGWSATPRACISS